MLIKNIADSSELVTNTALNIKTGEIDNKIKYVSGLVVLSLMVFKRFLCIRLFIE